MANFIESAISVIQAMVVGSIYIAIFYGKNPISDQNNDCDIEDDSSKIRRKKSKWSKSEDEGFESPNSPPLSPVDNQPESFPEPQKAPLANEEDLESVEKYETEVTKEKDGEAKKELSTEEKKKMFRKYPYFKLEVHIIKGEGLLAMDRGAARRISQLTGVESLIYSDDSDDDVYEGCTSDPYLKCMHGQDKLFLTESIKKTVNPQWDEHFSVHLDNPFKPITLQVFDKDMVGSDDFMGEASIELSDLNLDNAENFELHLHDACNEDLIKKNKKRKPLGSIFLNVLMKPMTKEQMNEEPEIQIRKISRLGEGIVNEDGQILRAQKMSKDGKGKGLSWSSVVHVVLVQARGLLAMDSGESSDPYCRIGLGKESRKSKTISCTINPKWREAFDFNWYEELDSDLSITIWDKDIGAKDDFMGRVNLELTNLDKEITHNLWRTVEDGAGQLNFLVTVTATTRGDSPSNLSNWEEELDQMKNNWINSYTIDKSFKEIKNVGHLMVKVFKAKGLTSADLGGKSDPFAVVELNNHRVSTHTEYKTLAPTWQKVFQFDVKDIHDVLEITVFDEDKDHKYEFLGKVVIPLLRIKNSDKRWYMLKDKKLRGPAKGEQPQILLEMFFVYNKIRASIRTFNPKQLKYEDRSDIKFKHSVFMKNVNRVKAATADFDPEVVLREIQSILNWDNKPKSAGAFAGFLLGVYFLEPWMITLGLLIPFIKNIIVMSVTGGSTAFVEDDHDDDDDDETKAGGVSDKDGEKKSLKEKMQAMQEITLMVQNGLGMLAHILESCANVFNFCVPFLSWLAFFVFAVVTLVLYHIPLRYLIMAWGTNKFTKKLLRPNAINNNELADFISRVPDNEELKNFRELPSSDDIAKKQSIKKKPASDADII